MLITAVIDGHGGSKGMQFLKKHFMSAFELIIKDLFVISEVTNGEEGLDIPALLETAFALTFEEADFAFEKECLKSVKRGEWNAAHVGACLLASALTSTDIVIANAGDARAILALRDPETSKLRALQISSDHNAREKVERSKLMMDHPNDPNVVVEYQGNVCYVKGALQTTRSIGDFSLKSKVFNEALPPLYRVGEPFEPPYITSKPEVTIVKRRSDQEYLILATDGLFDELSNDEVVEIVEQWQQQQRSGHSKGGSASQSLTSMALGNAARDIGVSVLELSRMRRGARRRNLHDDMTVLVIHLNGNNN
eukprot:g598.t1